MLKIIKDSTLVPTPIVDLKLDSEPRQGSTDPVTSEGVKTAIDGAVGDAAEALQEQIDDIAEKAGSGYTPKGEADVATLNGLSGQENGWLYTMTDAGTLTDGSLAVTAGDTVAWDATNSVWYKAMDYAPRQYGTNEVHNLATTATEADLVAGNFLAIDVPGVGGATKKMPGDCVAKRSDVNFEVSPALCSVKIVQGGVSNSTSLPTSNAYRCTSKWITGDGLSYNLKINSAGLVCLGVFKSVDSGTPTFGTPMDWSAGTEFTFTAKQGYQYAFLFAKDDGTGQPSNSVAILPSEVSISITMNSPIQLSDIDTEHYVSYSYTELELYQGGWNSSGLVTSSVRLHTDIIEGIGQELMLDLSSDFVCLGYRTTNSDGTGGSYGNPFDWGVCNKRKVTLSSGYYYVFLIAYNDGTGHAANKYISPDVCQFYELGDKPLILKHDEEIKALQEEFSGRVFSDSSQKANYRLTKLGVEEYVSGITGGVSDFIPVKKGDIIRFSLYSGNSYSVLCSYDLSKNFLSDIADGVSIYTASECSYLVDSDAVKYVRFYTFYPLSQQGSFKIESVPNYDEIGLRTGVVQVCIGGSVTYLSTDYCLKAWKNDGNVKQIITATNGAGLLTNNLFKNQWASVSDKASVTEIVIWISTNDWGSGQALGNKEDYTYIDNYDVSKIGTICGAFNELISLIRSDNASAKIKVLLPVPAFWGDLSKGDRGYNKFSTGTNPLYAMANAIKECCEIQLVPYLEQWNLIQCDPNTWQNKYENDGVHPNANGYAMLTPSQINFLRNT